LSAFLFTRELKAKLREKALLCPRVVYNEAQLNIMNNPAGTNSLQFSSLPPFAKALQAELLLQNRDLLDRYRATSSANRKRIYQVTETMVSSLYQKAFENHNPLTMFLTPYLEQRAWSDLARVLLPHIRQELSEEVEQILSRPATIPETLRLSLEPTSYACARYLAGALRMWSTPESFMSLPELSGRWQKALTTVEVAAISPAVTRLEAQELRAKTLILLITIAVSHEPRETGWYVHFADMLRAFGYAPGERTNARYYWQHFSEVVSSVLLELPAHVVRLPDGTEKPLLELLQVIYQDPKVSLNPPTLDERLYDPQWVQEQGFLGFRFRFSPELLELIAGHKPNEEAALVSSDFCALRGSAFWLAWRVAYWHYWKKDDATLSLLHILQEMGYLHGNRYKHALRAWWNDVAKLIEIELLAEPGVRLYRWSGGSYRDCSDRLSKLLDSDERLNAKWLGGVRVHFTY
jgi:hypothetical protein